MSEPRFVVKSIVWPTIFIGAYANPDACMIDPRGGIATMTGSLDFAFQLPFAISEQIAGMIAEAALSHIRKIGGGTE